MMSQYQLGDWYMISTPIGFNYFLSALSGFIAFCVYAFYWQNVVIVDRLSATPAIMSAFTTMMLYHALAFLFFYTTKFCMKNHSEREERADFHLFNYTVLSVAVPIASGIAGVILAVRQADIVDNCLANACDFLCKEAVRQMGGGTASDLYFSAKTYPGIQDFLCNANSTIGCLEVSNDCSVQFDSYLCYSLAMYFLSIAVISLITGAAQRGIIREAGFTRFP